MKKLTYLILLLLLTCTCQRQLTMSKIYYVDVDSEEVCCYIDFYDDGKYQITFWHGDDDILYVTPISYGTYKIKNDVIHMKDNLCGFDMDLRMKNDSLYPIKALDFIKKSKIACSKICESGSSDEIQDNINFTIKRREKSIKKFVKKEPSNCTLTLGTYKSDYGYGTYYLTLNDNGDYELRFIDVVVSQGFWKKKRKQLVLNDIELSHKFEFFVGEGRLISKSIPGEYGCIMKYTSEEELMKEKKEREQQREFMRNNNMFDELPDIDPDVYLVVEEWPEFVGGIEAMLEFIENNTNYPEKAKNNNIHGRVFVEFIVERDGSLSNIHLLHGIDPECNDEAVRVVSAMPKWQPGKLNGETVRVKYILYVNF